MILALLALIGGVAGGFWIAIVYKDWKTCTAIDEIHRKLIAACAARETAQKSDRESAAACRALREVRSRYESALGKIAAAIEESRKVEG
jgi:hypothetical protein